MPKYFPDQAAVATFYGIFPAVLWRASHSKLFCSSLLLHEPLWNELFPAEQARIVELLVERVDLRPDAIDLRLRVEGLTSLCSEFRGGGDARQEAA